MHKIYDYVCDELKALEKKVDSGQTLSMAEVQYADTLMHMKKNMLKIDEMEDGEGYSGRYMYDNRDGMRGGSYARGRRGNVRRDAMGRYSSDGYSRAEDDFMAELRELAHDAPDDHKRQKIQRLIDEMGHM